MNRRNLLSLLVLSPLARLIKPPKTLRERLAEIKDIDKVKDAYIGGPLHPNCRCSMLSPKDYLIQVLGWSEPGADYILKVEASERVR